jgi:hypothetical protein
MEQGTEKVTMADQVAISMTSPKNYNKLTSIKDSKTVAFVILMSFIFVFIEFGIGVITFIMHIGGFKNLIMNRVPEFVIENGLLDMESEFQMAIGDMEVYINTDYDTISLEDMESDGVYVAIGASNIVMGVVNGTDAYDYLDVKLADMFYDGFNNQALSSTIPGIYLAIVFAYIFSMFGKVIQILFLALIFSIVGKAVAKTFVPGMSYKNIFKVCIYGQTLSMFINAVNNSVGVFIPSSLMFLLTLILSFNFINRGIMSHSEYKDMPPRNNIHFGD